MSQATLRDLCAEAVNVDGTGDATFHGALRGHRTFAVAYAGALPLSGVRIKIEEANAQGYIVRWEDSECTVSEAGFTRDTCINSSNNGAFVEFGAGYKRAFVFIPVADVGGSGSITAADITDSSATGRAVLTGDATEGRSALGLGSAAPLDVAVSGDATAGQVVKGSDSRLTNDRTASGLRTATTVVSVSAATAPSAGQTLVATSSTAATWQTPASGGISAADLAGGTLPASLTTLATSGVATLGGLTVRSPSSPLASIAYDEAQVALAFRDSFYTLALYGINGINFTSQALITWSSTTNNHTVDRDLQVARNGANRMGIGSYGVWNDAALELGAVRKKPYTVGTLPVAPSAYDQRLVVDALAPAIGSAVVGGGGVAANVIWISPNWMVI